MEETAMEGFLLIQNLENI